jgi:GntR family transcriptional regulator
LITVAKSTIDRSSPVPIYYQIAVDLRQRIAQGEWKLDRQLPPESELAAQYHVSRMTLRQALAHLENESIIRRQRGSGTFIRQYPNRIVPTLGFPMSLTHQIRELGITPTATIIEAEVTRVRNSETAASLGLSRGEQVARFKRVFNANGLPVALSVSILPHSLCPGITESDLIDGSLSITLSQRYGLNPKRVDQWLGAAHPGNEEAELLQVGKDSPLLSITNLVQLDDGTPIEYALTTCVGDRLRLHIHAISGKQEDPTSVLMETVTI